VGIERIVRPASGNFYRLLSATKPLIEMVPLPFQRASGLAVGLLYLPDSMNSGLVSIAVLLPLLEGCTRHTGERKAQSNHEPSHITSLPPAGSVEPELLTKTASEPQTLEPQTLDRSVYSRPSPFSIGPEAELQQPALSQPAPIAPAPFAAAPSRAKAALRPEEDRKPLKKFIPTTVADISHDRIAVLPGPPALPVITQNPAPSVILGHKTCCVGTATFEAARPALVRRVLGKVPGLRRIHQSPANTDGYVAPRPAREINLVLPPEARAALTRGTMDLKATVNESGHVTRVQLLSPKDEELVRLAAYAAGNWPFVPAKINDEAVPSEVILHFTFNGN
jgi:TonB family protein